MKIDDKKNLLETIESYGERDYSRFHTPGHNGEIEISAKYDLTEIGALPCLYSDEEGVRVAERDFAKSLGVSDVYFSTHGATLAIDAMLYKTVGFEGKMVAGRNIHRSVVNAATLLDIDIEFINPYISDNAFRYSAEDAKEALIKSGAKILYLTSPDYYGNICDIEEFVAVANSLGAKVIVDNAHGSHLFSQGCHPIEKGAYATVDSIHKTLPTLTGAALLLFADEQNASEVKVGFALFGSTSPNFMILRSILKVSGYAKNDEREFLRRAEKLREDIKNLGFVVSGDDKSRICIHYAKSDLEKLSRYFSEKKVTAELLEEGKAVFILKSLHKEKDFKRLLEAMVDFPFSKEVVDISFPFESVLKNCRIREAVTAENESIPIELAIGRTAAEMVAPAPPGIPIVIPGENICEKRVKFLKKCGILKLKVIK